MQFVSVKTLRKDDKKVFYTSVIKIITARYIWYYYNIRSCFETSGPPPIDRDTLGAAVQRQNIVTPEKL